MLCQISLAWRNVKNNRRTIGLLSSDNWRGVKLWRNKNELSTLASCLGERILLLVRFLYMIL